MWCSTRPIEPVRSGAGALWRAALCLCKSPPPPEQGPRTAEPGPHPPPPPAGSPCWSRPGTSHCSSKTQSPSASSTSPSKCGWVMAGPRPSLFPTWPDTCLPWPLSGPTPWRPGTAPISSGAAMIHSPAPFAQCSELGTLWLRLEGTLRTWHCWWVCRGAAFREGSGRGS